MALSSRFELLLRKWVNQTLTPEERSEFMHLLEVQTLEGAGPALKEHWLELGRQLRSQPLAIDDRDDRIAADIISQYPGATSSLFTHRVHFLRRGWLKYAAAVILSLSISITAIVVSSDRQSSSSETTSLDLKAIDIPPGGEKAVLTLADGTKIILDEAANGQLASQGGMRVVKLANGQIAYEISAFAEASADEVWNTMTTPVGGQYQVTLPDGTKVWLNAASSITYPAAFVSNKRQVKITGEVYFEVAKNKTKPFLVDIDGQSSIEVLGTSFNVNSYQDEGNLTTTLVEGSVKVSNRSEQAILKPRQQATIASAASFDQQSENSAGIVVANNADIEKALAWKNGIFDFTGVDFRSVMKQLERWYDIKVRYNSTVPNMTFDGKMYRNVSLSDVLEVLQRMGVKVQMEGKTLIVL